MSTGPKFILLTTENVSDPVCGNFLPNQYWPSGPITGKRGNVLWNKFSYPRDLNIPKISVQYENWRGEQTLSCSRHPRELFFVTGEAAGCLHPILLGCVFPTRFLPENGMQLPGSRENTMCSQVCPSGSIWGKWGIHPRSDFWPC